METTGNFYSASEAREKLGGISGEELKRLTDAGKIEKIIPPTNKRKGLYKKADVDRLAEEIKGIEPTKGTKVADLPSTDWARSSDLPYMLAYDYEHYGLENTVDISITSKWWEKNPHMARILFNPNDRREIWGGITIMPLEEDFILRILRDEITEKQVTADDILLYEPGKSYYGYVASATVKMEHSAHFKALLHSVFDFWCNNYPDIQIKKLYAYAGSEKGWDLIKRLFFSPRYDINRNAFELDPLLRNPSKLIKPFQDCLSAKGAKIETPI